MKQEAITGRNLSGRPRLRSLAGNWSVFSPGGTRTPFSHYVKLAYGLGGVLFLIYTALTVSIGKSETARYEGAGESIPQSVPPSSWYWQWLVSSEQEQNIDSFSWGTDDTGNNLREWMGRGALQYIEFGLASSLLAVIGALIWGAVTEWPARARLPLPYLPSAFQRTVKSLGSSSLEMVDSIPKLLLLLAIYQAFGRLRVEQFAFGMAVFLALGAAVLFKGRIASYLASEEYIYAMEIGLPPTRIFFTHLLKRLLFPLLLVQIPFMVSAYVLWESTMAFLNLMVTGGSWGQLIRLNRMSGGSFAGDWSFWIPLLSLVFVVSSFYLLGDALRERLDPGRGR